MRLLVGAVNINRSYPAGWKKCHMPSTVTGAEKRYKTVTNDKNRHKNFYKRYIIQLRSIVETTDRLMVETFGRCRRTR